MSGKSQILFLFSCLITILSFGQDYSNIQFIENKGQWDSTVRFMGQVANGAFYILKNGYTVVQHNSKDLKMLNEVSHNRTVNSSTSLAKGMRLSIRSHAYNVSFLNSHSGSEVQPDKILYTYNNYILGNDPSKWAFNCKIYQGITVKNVYPNVDLRYYSGEGMLKYDFIVHPGGNVSDIALKYNGANKLQIKNHDLVIGTSVGNLKELAPYTYQYNEKGKVDISAKYNLKDNIVRFHVKDYDPNSTLIIDPNLVFCSFTGSAADNWGFTATYGPDGSMFGGGIVFSEGFPVSPGAYQTSFQGGETANNFENGFDIGLIKLTPDGSNRVFATYLGGNQNEFPQSLIVDQQGELIVAGRTDSKNYPAFKTIGPGGAFDIIITKLNAAGNGLVGSVRIGGGSDDGANITPYGGTGSFSLQQNYGDEARSEVNLDNAGNIYLASNTKSTDFPIVGGFQFNNGGNQDAVVLKMDASLSSLLFSTYLGGVGNDAAYVVSVNPLNNNIYVAGGTESPDLKGTTPGAFGATYNGNIDGFISVISNDGSTLLKTVYIGTGAIDQIYGLQFDNFGFPYIMGQTTGTWPILNAPWSQAGGKQFISKLQTDLSGFVYSTCFGTGSQYPNISPVAFLVDRCENVYISGWGGKIGALDYHTAGTAGLPVTPDAIKPKTDINQNGLGEDFYFFVLKKDAASQLYGSFFGQNGGLVDHVDGGTSRFDKNGVIYEAICANCGLPVRFPTTQGAWATSKPSTVCNLAMVKIAFNLSGVRGGVQPSINGRPRDSVGCIPLTVDFVDTVQIAKSYIWNFGDGSPQVVTTSPSISYTYNNIGSYKVMMIAIDSSTCNVSDTSYVTITAGNNKALLDYKPVKLNPCDSFKYRIDNLSVSPNGQPFTNQSFSWDLGDGTIIQSAGTESIFHNYASPGTYNIKLILNDNRYCNYPDTLVKQVRVAALVKARIQTPPTGCAPYDAQFINTSDAGNTFTWSFGDGTTSNEVSPSHLYPTPGTYIVKLVVIDSATCNIIDSTTTSISVYGKPKADFNATPQPPVKNTPISFTNLSSSDAIHFKWLYGDGDSLITDNRGITQYEYNATGVYNVCLIAINPAGCADTACRPVNALIEPAVDVPNAFTPLSGGINSMIFVRGFGIARMEFTIYARWGEKVFETNNRKIGWDGKFKGKLLPMDVYAYTLKVEFSNGTKATKTGDITLIR